MNGHTRTGDDRIVALAAFRFYNAQHETLAALAAKHERLYGRVHPWLAAALAQCEKHRAEQWDRAVAEW